MTNVDVKGGATTYRRIFHNRTLILLWSGQSISLIGDAFFSVSVMWVIYAQTGSVLQAAIIQVVWHAATIISGPIAGAYADRWDRKTTILVTNLLSAAIVGCVALAMPTHGRVSPLIVFIAIFLLNSIASFLVSARVSVLPEVVGKDTLLTANGLFATIGQAAALIGSGLAGIIIATVGALGAIVGDAFSFLVAAFTIALAPLPPRKSSSSLISHRHTNLLQDLRSGWQVAVNHPIIRSFIWLTLLINVAAFTGPLLPALVRIRLHGNAVTYGILEAVSVIGSMLGGVLSGPLARRLGAGILLIAGWGFAGICVLIMAFSSWLVVTASSEALLATGLVAGGVSVDSLFPTLVPEEYRGRVQGFIGSSAVFAVPLGALGGGWLADKIGPSPVFAIGGVWIIGVATLAWFNMHIRSIRSPA
jgi:DHA3 family macrolide efflux protein-like MFS transporter